MTRSTTREDPLTPTERRVIDEQAYWAGSLFAVEESNASIISGLELPILGGMLAEARDHAIGTSAAMLQHPDEDLRWTADIALVFRGKFYAAVRLTPGGLDVITFDTALPVPVERVLPGRRPPRSSSLIFIDGSFDSTCYGLGIPLAGRDLADVLEGEIRSICDARQHHCPAGEELDDVALSFRGRFLAVVRSTPDGPVVTRFPLPDSPSGRSVAHRAIPTPSSRGASR